MEAQVAAGIVGSAGGVKDDLHIIERVLKGETDLYELLIRRYNQRLFRAARAVVRDDAEAEDVVQDTWVRAYQHLNQFAGRAAFGTWLTRIAVHEAYARVRRRSRTGQLSDSLGDRLESEQAAGEYDMKLRSPGPDLEQTTSDREMSRIIERAILELPEQYRIVVMLRDVEEMSTSEAAEALELTEENVKVRLHRGRAMLKQTLIARVQQDSKQVFPFLGRRCDRMVRRVMEHIRAAE